MNIKLQTNEQLSATVANGLAGVFVNGVSLSTSLSSKADLTALQNCYIKSETSSANEISTALKNAGGKVYFDNRISNITGSNDLSVVKLSADEYAQMLDGGTCLSNAIYIVEAPNIDAFKQRITNVAPPTDLSDAATKEYVDNALTGVQIPTDLSAFTNSPGYTTNVGTITGITMNGASKGTSGNVDLGTVLTVVPTTYKTYSQTAAVLSNDGYATSAQVNQKSTVSFNRITTSGTNIGNITIDGTTTEIYAPTDGGGGSSVQVSANYQSGINIATISVDNVPTSIYVPNSGGGSSRYALVTAQLVSDSGSLTCAVDDQTITTIQVSSSTTPVVVQLPAQPTDGARDFILRIEISSSAAPTFTFNGASETIDFDSEDDDWAVMEPGLNLVSFTETKRGTGINSGGSTLTYYTVTFDIENGQNAQDAYASFTNPSDATRQVEAGQPVGTLPSPNLGNPNYVFQYWWTTASHSTGQQVTNQTIITNDTTFYAMFDPTTGSGD